MPEPPLRICLCIAHFPPMASGAERQAYAQGLELVRRGHSVHVVTRWYPHLPPEETIGGIRVHRFVKTSKIGPFFGISFVLGTVRALRDLRGEYDLIHTHQALWEAIAVGFGKPQLRGAPTLIQPASSGYYGEAQEMARTKGFPLLRRLALRNTAFAAISADIEREWLALGVPAEKMIRTASGVDAEHFRPGPSAVASSLPEGPKVVFTGRLHPQKNLDLLLDAWPAVARQTSATLVLVGDGVDRPRLEARARELGIIDRVHFAGFVEDPAEHLRTADAFVLPSVAEGMSNSLLEAMATALPCLASRIGGNEDLIGHEENGLLIPPGDVAAWESALIRVVEDGSFARRIGQAARERIDREFALPVVVDRYVALYRRLMA